MGCVPGASIVPRGCARRACSPHATACTPGSGRGVTSSNARRTAVSLADGGRLNGAPLTCQQVTCMLRRCCYCCWSWTLARTPWAGQSHPQRSTAEHDGQSNWLAKEYVRAGRRRRRCAAAHSESKHDSRTMSAVTRCLTAACAARAGAAGGARRRQGRQERVRAGARPGRRQGRGQRHGAGGPLGPSSVKRRGPTEAAPAPLQAPAMTPRRAESARPPPHARLERLLVAGAARRRRGAEPTAVLCRLPRMLQALLARTHACMRGAPVKPFDLKS